MKKRMAKLDFIKTKTFYLWTLCGSEETGQSGGHGSYRCVERHTGQTAGSFPSSAFLFLPPSHQHTLGVL